MEPNRRALEREEAAAREARKKQRAARDRLVIKEAQKVVGIWNARLIAGAALWFYPTIRAALISRCPWLTYQCPACRQLGDLDLRTVDRHPDASISSLIPSLRCPRCNGQAPFAKLKRLSKSRPR
jgi:hypothetical protein